MYANQAVNVTACVCVCKISEIIIIISTLLSFWEGFTLSYIDPWWSLHIIAYVQLQFLSNAITLSPSFTHFNPFHPFGHSTGHTSRTLTSSVPRFASADFTVSQFGHRLRSVESALPVETKALRRYGFALGCWVGQVTRTLPCPEGMANLPVSPESSSACRSEGL